MYMYIYMHTCLPLADDRRKGERKKEREEEEEKE
jgi:hypothetical protein